MSKGITTFMVMLLVYTDGQYVWLCTLYITICDVLPITQKNSRIKCERFCSNTTHKSPFFRILMAFYSS